MVTVIAIAHLSHLQYMRILIDKQLDTIQGLGNFAIRRSLVLNDSRSVNVITPALFAISKSLYLPGLADRHHLCDITNYRIPRAAYFSARSY